MSCERCHGSGYIEEGKTEAPCPECDGGGDSAGVQIAQLRDAVNELTERVEALEKALADR